MWAALFAYLCDMEEATVKEIELFIEEELSQHGEWLVDRFAEALEKNKNVDSGQLLESLDYTAAKKNPDGSIGIGITFMTYGRAMEIMGRRRKKRLKEQQNHDVWGKKNHRAKKVQWYNKNRYAGYGRLIRRLTAGMSDAELQRIRGIIEEQKKRFAAKS